MARKLSHITAKIKGHLATHYGLGNIFSGQITIKNNVILLPNQLEVAFLRGEALFCERFFKSLEQKNIIDSQSHYNNYQALVSNKKHFQELSQDTKLLDFFNINDNNPSQHAILCYQLYCVVLFDAKNRNNSNLVDAMTIGFVNHFLPMLYPQNPSNNDIVFLKKELTTALRRRWNLKITIKESFTTENQADFSLFANASGYKSVLLIKQTGVRLKPTKISSYQEIIKLLKNPNFKLEAPKPNLAIK
jgi:hypothetical protein